MTSLLDRIEDLPPELRRMIWKVSIDNIERQELEARNSLSTYIQCWIFKLKDRWILQEQPSSILHHLKQCMASRHPWIESSCGTEYLEELIATQDVIFGYHHRLFRYNTSDALEVAASVRK